MMQKEITRSPYWVGDDGPTEDLTAIVHQMLIDAPRRFVELLEATGARENRIKGVILWLQRQGVVVVDASRHGGKALWFIPDLSRARVAASVKAATERAA